MLVNAVNVSGSLTPVSVPAVSYGGHFNGSDYEFITESDLFSPTARMLANQPNRLKRILSSPKQLTASSFGMHFNKVANSDPSVRVAIPSNIQAGIARSHDSGVRWQQMNPSSGVYDWTAMDLWLSSVEARGMIPVYVVFGTPNWASARPAEASAYGINGLAAEPASMTTLSTFMTAFVNRYGNRVKHFEIWNEVSSSNFFSGSLTALANMVEAVATSVKAVVPDAKIIAPSVTGWKPDQATSNETYFGNMLNATATSTAVLKNLVDIIAIHTYPEKQRFFDIPEIVGRAKAVMTSAGVGSKPLWDTEVGILTSPVSPELMTDQQYYLNMVRAQLYSVLSGCDSCFWYGWDYGTGVGYTMGFHLRPAVLEMRQILSNLIGKTVTEAVRLHDGTLFIATNNGSFTI